MSNAQSGIAAIVGACLIWGCSPIFYKLLAHIPAQDVLAHRTLWSLVFFAGVLALRGRLGELGVAMRNGRNLRMIAMATILISINWYLFILATQIGRNMETSLGYYMLPLVAVLIGRVWFNERLRPAQWFAVALAAVAVALLGRGLGEFPWISLVLAISFSLYGVIKKMLPLGPIVSVTCEVLVFLPVSLVLLAIAQTSGQGAFAATWQDNLLLIASGPITAMPLILFSVAAQRIAMSTVGVLLYINPTLQFLSAVVLFNEAFTMWHAVAFALIWVALAIYSMSLLRQDKASRRVAMAASGVSTTSRNSNSDGSANP